MGVDISTWRARIGSFGPRLGRTESGSIGITTTSLVLLIGAVIFIRQLLVIGGIEQNPGPLTGMEFTFRYQYLLIEIGTRVLRQLFDHLVKNDFGQYLIDNPAADTQLQNLILKKVITADQQRVLPPIDTKPSSTNFDITMLCCLLRNVCGLKSFSNNSWIKPTSTDNSVEANITRLRECRNVLYHSGSVFCSAVGLDAKWKNLCKILNDINTVCKVPNLTSLIHDTENMDIDEKLKKHYDIVLRVWTLADNSEELIHGQTLLLDGQSTLTKGQSQLKQSQTELKDGQSQIIKNQTQQADGHLKLTDGQAQLKDGQLQIISSQTQLTKGQTQLNDGQLQIISSQKQLADGQTQLKDGQSQIISSQTQLTKGQTQLNDGQLQIISSQKQLAHGQTQLKDGHSQIINSQTQLTEGQTQLRDGQSQIINSQTKLIEGQKQVVSVQSQMFHKLDTIDHSLQEGQQKRLINESELKNHLITLYNEECSTLPVLPLCEGDDDERELLSFYQPPSLNHKPYHESQGKDEYEVLSYKEIFNKDDKHFRKVYITGDAGTGKTSLCKRMVFLWCKSMSGETVGDKKVQNDIEFMANFDFVFYVYLGVAYSTDIINIIAEQLFCNVNDDKKKLIELILKTQKCLVIMDALDEFNENGKINTNKLLSDKCTFMITCRPFVIETHRLSPNDIDRQIKITGITADSITSYVNEIVNHMNEATGRSKIADNFLRDADASEVYEQLHIPILGSHLVWLWFNHGLTHMSQALIYSHIIDMLLNRTEAIKHVTFPSSTDCDVQFPDSLSGLIYFKQNAGFLKKICLLSFNLLFKKENTLSQLVFTKEQLMSKPYNVTVQEINALCKFGFFSKSKVTGTFGKREQKLAFLHKSYLEYFAALFVSSFDMNNDFDNVVTSWKSNDTMQHETFFRFYVGFSPTKIIQISGDLNLEIINRIFRPYTDDGLTRYENAIVYIQGMVKRVFKRTRAAYEINMSCLKIEHIDFDPLISDYDILKQLVKLNSSDVKSLFIYDQGTYLDAFDEINKLQILVLEYPLLLVSTSTFKMFTERVMLNNKSTLHTVSIANHYLYDFDSQSTDIPLYIPFKQLNCLTSISVCDVTLQHNNYDDLISFLSKNTSMENIRLDDVKCNTHRSQCTWTIDLTNKTKLRSLSLVEVNIVCKLVNRSDLPNIKSLILQTIHENMAAQCVDLFNAIRSSQITYIYVNGSTMLDSTIIKPLVSTIQSLKSIRELRLWSIDIPDDVLLQFHTDVSEIEVHLCHITMSKTWFDTFTDTIRTTMSTINVWLRWCKLTTVVGGNCHVMPVQESVDYMYNRVIKIPNVEILYKYDRSLLFERKASDH